MLAGSLVTGLMLVPTLTVAGVIPNALAGPLDRYAPGQLPGAGDVLAALRQDGTLGAGGQLPENAGFDPEAFGPGSPDAGPLADLPDGPLGIPGILLEAYVAAEGTAAADQPGCRLDWALLAGIGRVESNHARGGQVGFDGTTLSPILGPVLNGGPGMAAIADSDGGRLDGDVTWDRAVGSMQFIPTTWAGYAADGNGDGTSDPNNVFDATLAAGRYLCSGGLDVSDPAQRARAVFRYNNSDSYVRTVLRWADAYAAGVTPLDPDLGYEEGGSYDSGLPP